MKITLLHPRLDCSFKEGPVPVGPEGRPNNPVRNFYLLFRQRIIEFCTNNDVDLVINIKPLWQFTVEDCKGFDAAFIPHRQHYEFPVDNGLYYMQMGLPWLFQIDPKGWCADASDYPLQPREELLNGKEIPNYYMIHSLAEKLAHDNISKFAQSNKKVELPGRFIFFACQLPHDTTITNHSDVTVAEALTKTLMFGKEEVIPVLVKGHPINLGSMGPLKEVFKEHSKSSDVWIDEMSIHQALKECEAMFSVNSGGVGLEAILHRKPIFNYGRADYDYLTLDANNIQWNRRFEKIKEYEAWLCTYFEQRYNVYTTESFNKLKVLLDEI